MDWEQIDGMLGTLPDTRIAKITGVGVTRIWKRRNHLGIPTYQSKYGYWKYDVKFFDEIDDGKAYWLGYYVADGCVSKIVDGRTVITISSNDGQHIKKLAVEYGALNLVRIRQRENGKNHYTLALHNKYLFDQLVSLGCVPRKSARSKAPNIDEEFYLPFILGLYDGDGSISLNRSINSWKVSYGTGSKELFDWVLSQIERFYLKYSVETRDLKRRFYTVTFNGLSGKVWLDKLYGTTLDRAIPLQRKRKLYEKMCQESFRPPRWFDWEVEYLKEHGEDVQKCMNLIVSDKRNYGWERSLETIYWKRRQVNRE